MNKLAAYELLLEDHPLWIKEADMSFTSKGHGETSVTAFGAFIGRRGGHRDFLKLLPNNEPTLRNIIDARDKYERKFPDDFITLAVKNEAGPGKGEKNYKEKLKFFKERANRPAALVMDGDVATKDQSNFYLGVGLGLPPSKRDKIHLLSDHQQRAAKILSQVYGSTNEGAQKFLRRHGEKS